MVAGPKDGGGEEAPPPKLGLPVPAAGPLPAAGRGRTEAATFGTTLRRRTRGKEVADLVELCVVHCGGGGGSGGGGGGWVPEADLLTEGRGGSEGGPSDDDAPLK